MNPLAYSLGGLLYAPATNRDVAAHILHHDWPCLTAVSLCLEDAIQDTALPEAEAQLKETLRTLRASDEALPKLFVRVRSPEHFLHVHAFLGDEADVLTGYIFPKFDLTNAEAYLSALQGISTTFCPSMSRSF